MGLDITPRDSWFDGKIAVASGGRSQARARTASTKTLRGPPNATGFADCELNLEQALCSVEASQPTATTYRQLESFR